MVRERDQPRSQSLAGAGLAWAAIIIILSSAQIISINIYITRSSEAPRSDGLSFTTWFLLNYSNN